MKILIVRPWPYELNLKGYNVQETGLARALVRRGHTCGIVLYRKKGKSYSELLEEGIVVYHLRGFNILKNGIFIGLSKIAKKYDIIQTNEYDQIQSWMLYRKCSKKTGNGKRIVVYHGPYYDEFNKGYNLRCKLFDILFLSRSSRKLAGVVCMTKSPQAADFLKSKGFTNVRAVGVGIDPKPFENVEIIDQRIKLPENKINILYVGKIEERRNIDFLLSLYEELSLDDRFYFTIIGNGEKEYVSKMMPQIMELEKRGCLQYFEKASQQELSKVYQASDIMLFPSNYDIFGMVLLEAMYFGCIVISSNNGGSGTLISSGDDGVICNSFDKKEWISHVHNIIADHDKMTAMKDKASKKIREHYTWDKIAAEFESEYLK